MSDSSSEGVSSSQHREKHNFQQPSAITSQRKKFNGRYPPEFLANLPDGVTYNDPSRKSDKSISDNQLDLSDPNIV